MRIGLYPGTFDPVTLGHIDIIRRATALVDRLVIGVAINRDKGPLFPVDERVAMIEAEVSGIAADTGTEIVVHPFENLLVDCAHDVGATIILRGLRAVADFEYEYQMVGMNRHLDGGQGCAGGAVFRGIDPPHAKRPHPEGAAVRLFRGRSDAVDGAAGDRFRVSAVDLEIESRIDG